MKLTYIPKQILNSFQGLEINLRQDHYYSMRWFAFSQMFCEGNPTIANLARLCDCGAIEEEKFRRLLYAEYWDYRNLIHQSALKTINSLPRPSDGVYHLVMDSTYKAKRSKQNPLCKKGKLNTYSPYVFGLHMVFFMLQWDNYRVIIDFEIVRPKEDPDYKSENEVARTMLARFQAPKGAKEVIVLADAAFGSKKMFTQIKLKGFYFVFCLAKTWCFNDGKKVKDFASHVRHDLYKKTWFPIGNGRRKMYWTYTKRARLRNLGDVTIVLSKKRRNSGPKKTKVLVTNLPQATARKVGELYRRRWWIEVAFKELKGAIGMGKHQVTGKANRIEKSIAIAVVAYQSLIRLQKKDIPKTGSWSVFQLKQNFILKVAKEQLEHSALQMARKIVRQKLSA